MKLLLVLNRAFHDPTRGSGQDVKKNIAGPVGSGRSGGVRNFQEISREISRVRLSLFQEFFLVGSGLGSGLEVFQFFRNFPRSGRVGSGLVWRRSNFPGNFPGRVGSGRDRRFPNLTDRVGSHPDPARAEKSSGS